MRQIEGKLQGMLVGSVHDTEVTCQSFKLGLCLVIINGEHEI